MENPVRAETVAAGESPQNENNVSLAQKIGTVATCMIAPADLLVSDAIAGMVYQSAHRWVDGASLIASHIIPDVAVGALIWSQSALLAVVIARNKNLQGAASGFDDYLKKRQAEMSRPRLLLSKFLNLPLAGLEKLGDASKWVGNRIVGAGDKLTDKVPRISAMLGRTALIKNTPKTQATIEKILSHGAQVLKSIGTTAIDLGIVNSIGTSGEVLAETMATDDNSPPFKRIAWLSGLITISWIGGAELVRAANDNVPGAHYPLQAIGYAFEHLTNFESPIGALVLALGTFALARFGWKVSELNKK